MSPLLLISLAIFAPSRPQEKAIIQNEPALRIQLWLPDSPKPAWISSRSTLEKPKYSTELESGWTIESDESCLDLDVQKASLEATREIEHLIGKGKFMLDLGQLSPKVQASIVGQLETGDARELSEGHLGPSAKLRIVWVGAAIVTLGSLQAMLIVPMVDRSEANPLLPGRVSTKNTRPINLAFSADLTHGILSLIIATENKKPASEGGRALATYLKELEVIESERGRLSSRIVSELKSMGLATAIPKVTSISNLPDSLRKNFISQLKGQGWNAEQILKAQFKGVYEGFGVSIGIKSSKGEVFYSFMLHRWMPSSTKSDKP